MFVNELLIYLAGSNLQIEIGSLSEMISVNSSKCKKIRAAVKISIALHLQKMRKTRY